MRCISLVLNPFTHDSRVERQAESLARQGYEVSVYALHEGNLPKEEHRSLFSICRFPLATRSWSRHRLVQLVKYVECIARMTSAGVRARPAVVHANDLNALPIGYIIAKLTGARLVYDAHELWSNVSQESGFLPPRLHRFEIALEAFLARRSNAIITVSESIAQHMAAELGIEKPVVIRNLPVPVYPDVTAVDGHPLRQALDLPEGIPILLYQGRVARGRGLETFIDSMPRIQPPAVLVVLGDGPAVDPLRDRVQELGLEGRIHFHAAVPRADLPGYTADATIGLVPISDTCLSYRYCLPNKLFEYLQAGLPIVATDLPEIEKVVQSWDVGETYRDGDGGTLVAAVDRLLSDPGRLARTRDRARAAAAELHWGNEERVLVDVYRRIAGDPDRTRVAHLTVAHPPFDIRIFHKEAVSIARAGYDVYLVAPHDRHEDRDGVRLRGIRKPRRRLARMLGGAWRVYREGRRLHAAVYHIHDAELIGVGLLLRLGGARVVYDAHEDAPRTIRAKDYIPAALRRPIGWALEVAEGFAARRVFSAVVAATPTIANRFRPVVRTQIVQNFPLPAEVMRLSDAPPLDERPQVVAYVGAITKNRGLHQMVQAMGALPPNLEATLELAGDMSPSRLRSEVCSLPGWVRVRELGTLDRDGVLGLLSRARVGLVVLHPESRYQVAFPIKLFEYMAGGVPVIASDFPLWRRIVDEAGCGLLVDPLDSEAIARAVAYLLENPIEARLMGERGRMAIRERYNWRTEEQRLLDIYSELTRGSTTVARANDGTKLSTRWAPAVVADSGVGTRSKADVTTGLTVPERG